MPRPTTTLPKCNDFNQIVTLDLKQWGQQYILWMVCSFTRFLKGVVIAAKDARIVVEAVMKHWNCNFGIPSIGYWSDNGCEFKNADMLEFFAIKMVSQSNLAQLTALGPMESMNGIMQVQTK